VQEHAELDDDRALRTLDRLCYALGLLTNLVQVSEEGKDLTRETRKDMFLLSKLYSPPYVVDIDPKCTSGHKCLYTCICQNPVGALDVLSLIHLSTTTSDPGSAFLRGHLAVMFGILMRDNTANQKVILSSPPGSLRSTKLDKLIEQAREFSLLYADLTSKMVKMEDNRADENDEADSSPQCGAERKIVEDGKGQRVTRDVVAFLEGLQDRQSAK
jgi:hypothetical protein